MDNNRILGVDDIKERETTPPYDKPLRGMQVLGGYSYMIEYGMERYLRECKLWEIAGGTNQIQRNIIARHLARGGPGD